MENFTMASNASVCSSVDHSERRRAFLFFYTSVIAASIPLNAFSAYVSWQHVRQRNELGVYLLNLAVCDLTFTVGLSLWLDFLWHGVWTRGGHACLIAVYFLFTNFYASEGLLCCIAVDRYLAVVHPQRCAPVRRVGAAAAVSTALWTLVVAFNAGTIRWEDSYQEGEVPVCFDIFIPLSGSMVRANVLRFALGFAAPALLVVFSSWRICVAVKSNQATDEQERRRVTKLLQVVLLSLLICFGPIHVMMLLRLLVDHCRNFAWFFYPYKVCTAISTLNCLADPLLYCFITRTGQEKVHKLFLFFQLKKRSQTSTTESV